MENTSNSIVYAVNSDLDDGLLYAEFENKDAAIDYAKQHLDKLPFVDELEVSYDANGEIEDVFNYKTIWDHTMSDQEAEVAVADAIDTEDAYWDFKGNQEVEAEKNKYDLGDTTWFESMDNLVEEMEENEDMVECKECFDLFPKTDCIKIDFGYVCPTCHNNGKVFTVSDNEVFNVDFPEYEKMNIENDMIPEEPIISEIESNEEVPVSEPVSPEGEPELTADEAVPFLVNDEVEAVAGYEKAAEVVADSDLENKEEILNTIEHIKEEEEEHIEELQDLVDDEIVEVENETTSELEKENEVVEEPLEENAQRAGGFRTDGYRTAYACYDSDDFDINVELGMQDEEEYEVEDQLYLLCPGQTVADLVVYLSRECGFTNVYVHTETSANRNEIKTATRFTTVPGDHDYRHYGSIQDRLVEHINNRAEPIESDQELEGTDNAVVKCKVADVVTHSEDEKPVDCEGKKKPLEKPLTEGFIFSLTNEKDLTEFTQLCQEVGIKTIGDLDRFTKETAGEPGNILDKLRSYRKELGSDFKIKESLYNFTEEEMTEYNMDEDGISLDSYDEYVRCNWCGEVFTVDQCIFEANMGWLCDRCYSAIRSRGEKLTILTNPTDEEIISTLTEAKKMARDDLIAKEGTDDVDLVNAGREEDRVELEESVTITEDIETDKLDDKLDTVLQNQEIIKKGLGTAFNKIANAINELKK